MKLLTLLFLGLFFGCATTESVNTWLNRKTIAEQAIISAQQDVNAAAGAGAEIYAQKEYFEARSFIMTARQLQEDGNHKTAQEMAERASAAARKAKEKAEEEKIRKRSGRSKKGW